MPRYFVSCEEKLWYEVEVFADSEEAAIEKVKDNLPDYNDCYDSEFDYFEARLVEEGL